MKPPSDIQPGGTTDNGADEPGRDEESKDTTANRVTVLAAAGIFAVFCVFSVILLLNVNGDWDRMLYVYATFETLAVAAAGVLLGERLSGPSRKVLADSAQARRVAEREAMDAEHRLDGALEAVDQAAARLRTPLEAASRARTSGARPRKEGAGEEDPSAEDGREAARIEAVEAEAAVTESAIIDALGDLERARSLARPARRR